METTSTSEPLDSIAELTRRLASGDEIAFRQFHERYFDRLYQFLLIVARGRESEAQDALQQTLLRVARYARTFESEDAFWSWLKVLARTAARDAGRKEQRYAALLQRFALWQRGTVERESAQENLLYDVLEESLQELRADDRRLLDSKYADGEKMRVLAQESGLSERAVETRLFRLRRHLRERIINKLRSV